MNISSEYPPNIADIKKVLSVLPNTVFCYEDTLYNPDNVNISTDLMRHEQTHQEQQADYGVEKWWQDYLCDEEFRLTQELEAYRNQWQAVQKSKERYKELRLITMANDLSGQMYGHILTLTEAMYLIRKGGGK